FVAGVRRGDRGPVMSHASDLGSWRSAALRDGAELDEAPAWVQARRAAGYRVEQVPLAELSGWCWQTHERLEHASGRFFSVEGYVVGRASGVERTTGARRRRVQPLLDQPEIVLLGLLSVVEDGVRYLLLQAKMEP